MMILIPSAAGLIALAAPLIRFLFTDAYRSAVPFLESYAIFYALSAIPQDVLARARADSVWILRTAVAFGVGALAATFAGAELFGAIGALRAFVLVQVARRLYALYYFSHEENAGFTKVFPVKSAAVITAGAILAGLAAHIVANHLEKPIFAFSLGAFAFTPIYVGTLLLLRPRAIKRLLRFRRRK
jgi:O-antigen/teichoic acid export membrane protein